MAGADIGARVRRARINDDIGQTDNVNVQGEVQEKLDIISDECVLRQLKACASAGVYGSEEQPEAVVIRSRAEGGEFCILSDPLDGSSNIDVAAPVGTIFSIFRNERDGAESVLQAGRDQVASGYVIYGSSTIMVIATHHGVHMYVLDPQSGEYVAVCENLRIPSKKKIYSINEGYTDTFSAAMRRYLVFAHKNGYGARYIGSMVADVHRTLLKGGVFIYPATEDHPSGKLRLMYEANPMSYVIERAGGKASTGTERILDVIPSALHQRIPVILGSSTEVDRVDEHLR